MAPPPAIGRRCLLLLAVLLLCRPTAGVRRATERRLGAGTTSGESKVLGPARESKGEADEAASLAALVEPNLRSGRPLKVEPARRTGRRIASRVIEFLERAGAEDDRVSADLAMKALAIQMQALQQHQSTQWQTLAGQCRRAVTSARQHLAAWGTREKAQTRLLLQRLAADRDLRQSIGKLNTTRTWLDNVLRSIHATNTSVSKWDDDVGRIEKLGERLGQEVSPLNATVRRTLDSMLDFQSLAAAVAARKTGEKLSPTAEQHDVYHELRAAVGSLEDALGTTKADVQTGPSGFVQSMRDLRKLNGSLTDTARHNDKTIAHLQVRLPTVEAALPQLLQSDADVVEATLLVQQFVEEVETPCRSGALTHTFFQHLLGHFRRILAGEDVPTTAPPTTAVPTTTTAAPTTRALHPAPTHCYYVAQLGDSAAAVMEKFGVALDALRFVLPPFLHSWTGDDGQLPPMDGPTLAAMSAAANGANGTAAAQAPPAQEEYLSVLAFGGDVAAADQYPHLGSPLSIAVEQMPQWAWSRCAADITSDAPGVSDAPGAGDASGDASGAAGTGGAGAVWYMKDVAEVTQGPFSGATFQAWYREHLLPDMLMVRSGPVGGFKPLMEVLRPPAPPAVAAPETVCEAGSRLGRSALWAVAGARALTVEAWLHPRELPFKVAPTERAELIAVGAVSESAANPNSGLQDGAGPYRRGFLLGVRAGKASVEDAYFEFGLKAKLGEPRMTVLRGPTAEPLKWRHLAGVWNGTWMKLYVDGELVDSAENRAAMFEQGDRAPLMDGVPRGAENRVLYGGSGAQPPVEFLALRGAHQSGCAGGELADVALWTAALNATEVAARFAAGRAGEPPCAMSTNGRGAREVGPECRGLAFFHPFSNHEKSVAVPRAAEFVKSGTDLELGWNVAPHTPLQKQMRVEQQELHAAQYSVRFARKELARIDGVVGGGAERSAAYAQELQRWVAETSAAQQAVDAIDPDDSSAVARQKARAARVRLAEAGDAQRVAREHLAAAGQLAARAQQDKPAAEARLAAALQQLDSAQVTFDMTQRHHREISKHQEMLAVNQRSWRRLQ